MVPLSLVLSRPFISPCYTLLKYYLPTSLKRLPLLLLLLLLLRAEVTQEFHTLLQGDRKIIYTGQ
jgi:hypothetical protein